MSDFGTEHETPAQRLTGLALQTPQAMTILLDEALPKFLREADQTLTSAEDTFNRWTNPQSYLTPQELQASIAKHQPTVDKARQEATQTVNAVTQQLRQIEDVVNMPLSPVLTEAEMQQAATFAPFIKEEVERLEIEDLRQNIYAALVLDDRVKQWLYYRYYSLNVRPKELNANNREVVSLLDEVGIRLADKRFEPLREKVKAIKSQVGQLCEKVTPPEAQKARMRQQNNYRV